jgi:GH25 family lysozyme M1 (1,4-beta-N-acetylmuramidase)
MNQERTLTPAKSRSAPSRLREKEKSGGWGILFPVCVLLAAVLAAAFVVVTHRSDPIPEVVPEPITFLYRGQVMEADETIPAQQYDQAAFAVDESTGRVSYWTDYHRAKVGVDVSYYQGEIDWQAVAEDGIDFAILRLGYRGYTQGGLKQDSWFARNLEEAAAAGLDVGVYFFSQAITPEEAQEEADFVAQTLAGQSLTYPVVFDWEYITSGDAARTDDMTGETLTQCALAFCDRVRELGYEAAIYFNQDMGYFTLDLSALTDNTFWLAEYDEAPDFYYDFDLWQYTETGTVAGIQGYVDLNLDMRPIKAIQS